MSLALLVDRGKAGVGQWSGAAAECRRCCTAVHHGPTVVLAVLLMTSTSFQVLDRASTRFIVRI